MAQDLRISISESEVSARVPKASTVFLLLTTIRPDQWVKNLFILAPLLFGRKLTDISAVYAAALAVALRARPSGEFPLS